MTSAFVAAVILLATLALPASATTTRWIVPSDAALPAGATVLATIPVADAVVVESATAPADAAPADSALTWQSLPASDAADSSLDSAVASVRADQVWPDTRGERAVVALIDTGVAPVAALDGAVAAEVDFTGSGGGDSHGHGTFVASVIAGRGPLAPGVAPGAGVVSLKVGRADGSTDLLTVLRALQWLDSRGRGLGLRVGVLSLGVDASTEAGEVLDAATERLARSGFLMVTASGNGGAGTLTAPATSPATLSVGAVDDGGTATRSDDVPASFSGSGVDRLQVAQPDLVASGVRVVGSIHPDSLIARANPQAVIGPELLRGSGTSVSAALAAGVAALASSARPDLGGDALDAALRASGGELDAVDAVEAALDTPAKPRNGRTGDNPGDGTVTNSSGNGNSQPEWGGPNWKPVVWQGGAWSAASWGAASWGAASWGAASWGAASWGAASWGAASWGAASWGAASWGLALDVNA